jgi:preprotein translocase subunit YajC
MGNAATTAAAATSSGGSTTFLIIIVVIFIGFYFLLIRPQRNRQRKIVEQQKAVRPGQRVRTTAGMYATVVAVDDDDVVLEVAPGVEVRYVKRAIMEVLGDVGIPGEAGDETAETGGSAAEPAPGYAGAGYGDAAEDGAGYGDAAEDATYAAADEPAGPAADRAGSGEDAEDAEDGTRHAGGAAGAGDTAGELRDGQAGHPVKVAGSEGTAPRE